MFSLKALGGIVHGGVVEDFKARYPAWTAWPGVGSLLLSNIVLYILLFLVASITIDVYGEGSSGVRVPQFDGLPRP